MRKCKSLMIKVLVFDIATGEQVRELIIDIKDREKRKWLPNLVIWATVNNKSVEMINIEDDKQ